jgi:hypothetical protein
VFKPIIIILLLSVPCLSLLAGPDPMRPPHLSVPVKPAKVEARTGHWRLSLIREEGQARAALINGKLVRVGSRVDGARVAAIGKQQALLQLPDARSIKLELPSLKLKKENR